MTTPIIYLDNQLSEYPGLEEFLNRNGIAHTILPMKGIIMYRSYRIRKWNPTGFLKRPRCQITYVDNLGRELVVYDWVGKRGFGGVKNAIQKMPGTFMF